VIDDQLVSELVDRDDFAVELVNLCGRLVTAAEHEKSEHEAHEGERRGHKEARLCERGFFLRDLRVRSSHTSLITEAIPNLQRDLARIREMRTSERIAQVDKISFVRQIQRAYLCRPALAK